MEFDEVFFGTVINAICDFYWDSIAKFVYNLR